MLRFDFDIFFLGTAMFPVFRQPLAWGAVVTGLILIMIVLQDGKWTLCRFTYFAVPNVIRNFGSWLSRIIIQRQRQVL